MKVAMALALSLAAAVVANFLGMVFGVIKPVTFWIVAVIAGITAYKVIPKLRKYKEAHGGTRTPE